MLSAAAQAQPSPEKILPLDAQIDGDGNKVHLNWFKATPPRVGTVTVKRRFLGQTGAASWKEIASGLGPVLRYTDETTNPGVAYEYMVQRTARDIVDIGYWTTGIDLPAQEFRGTAYVVVDKTLQSSLTAHLSRFEQDLTGDGWQVHRLSAQRDNDRDALANLREAARIKDWLRAHYLSDPFGTHALILVGHLPVLQSGQANPDGHERQPHPTDLFYADMDGVWSASPSGHLMNNTVPGDFIEMQVGRIDFASVAVEDQAREIHLLRRYFDKNHHWRHGMLGDLRAAYGANGHLEAEVAALGNIVGPQIVVAGGHHTSGEEQPWLWGVGSGHWDGKQYVSDRSIKAVFSLNFGSGKQRFDRPVNAMAALLAQPWYTLATGWGGRPAWRLHPMALGKTVGEIHQRTVNNGSAAKPYRETMDYFPTGLYLWRNPVWVNLLGDPTARAFPLSPPTQVVLRRTQEGAELSWRASPDPDVLGYRVYRATAGSAAFSPLLAQGELVETESFTDPDAPEIARYMIRGYGRKRVYAGSFFTFSQGAFSTMAPAGSTPAPLKIRGKAGHPLPLPTVFSQMHEGETHALIEGPQTGSLQNDGTGWIYNAPEGFSGTVFLPVSVYADGQTRNTYLEITIIP